jgi:branched-chain amino acid transport system substrate-binding protein
MNIGILFPRSAAHPNMGLDFFGGLKIFVKQGGLNNDINFFTENIGFGGSEKEVYAKAEKLLLMDEVDILIGFIDEKVIDMLKPLMFASGKLLLVVNPGANHPHSWIPQSNIIHLGLQHAFLCALTGLKTGGKRNKKSLMASTFYDCGYMHLAAMVRQFLRAGGNISFNYVNNDLYDDNFNIRPLTDFLAANKETTNLLCIFDSLPASLFYHRLNAYEDAGNLQLCVSPMMLEPRALENLQDGFKFSIDGYLPWHSSFESAANHDFISACRQQTKKETNIFSLLGWETGMILQQIYLTCKDDCRDGNVVTEALKKNSITGPRGEMKLDPVTQYFIAPAIKCSIEKNSAKMEMEYNINLENEWEGFVEEPIEGVASGWTNTYLSY